jgi:hypothetical protein
MPRATVKPPMHPRSGTTLEGGNIDLYNRPKVKNKDGSVSTVYSMSFQNNKGQNVLIPGVERTGKGLLHQKQAQEQYGRTGEHLGKFKTPEAADKYAERLHKNQEKAYMTRPRQKTARKK